MKYHSRSPQEWKKIDEEKMKLSRTNELRRRSLIFLFMNFVMVIAVIFVVRIYNLVNPAGRGAVGPLRLVISLKDTFTFGETVDVKVKLMNTSKSPVSFVIEKFEFVIVAENGKRIYSFVHTDPVSAEMEGLSTILVFDLEREVNLDDLDPGRYTVEASALVNGKEVGVSRNFQVVVKISVGLGGFQPFLFVGEDLDLDIAIFNDSLRKVDVNVEKLKITLKKGESKIDESEKKIRRRFELDPGEGALLSRYSPDVVFSMVDRYTLEVVVKTDRGDVKEEKPFAVITKDQTSVKSLRFYIETPISVGVGEEFDIKISVYNDSKENRYVAVDEFIVTFGNGSNVFSDRMSKFRIWVPPYSKVLVFEKKNVRLESSGVYKLVVLMKTPKGNISKTMEIRAGGI